MLRYVQRTGRHNELNDAGRLQAASHSSKGGGWKWPFYLQTHGQLNTSSMNMQFPPHSRHSTCLYKDQLGKSV